MNTDLIAQIIIPVTGFGAVFLSQCKSAVLNKWAPILGLLGQPAWFATTYINEQWGIFAVSFLYASAWGMGFYNKWIKA